MTDPAPKPPAFASWLGETNEVTRTFLSAGSIQGLINLGGGLPERATYPAEELAGMAQGLILDHPAECLDYAPIEGLAGLRDVIAARFSRGALRLGRENVLITSGGMQGLDLLGKVLIDAGSTVAVQSPTYLGALDAWRPRAPVFRPMDLAVDLAADLTAPDCDATATLTAALTGAQFAYTVPNFSNPTGRLVPTELRQALVRAAKDTGTWLVEDDPYGALYYDGAPLPRMLDLAAQGTTQNSGRIYDGRVIYMGTLSKELAPGFRIGWMIAAPEMIAALTLAKQSSDLSTSGLSQRIAQEALSTGLLERLLPRILDTYRPRRDALLAAMEAHLAPWFSWSRPEGGMFAWATARDPGLDTDLLLKAGLDRGVCISPGSVFDPLGQDRRSLRINFTANSPERLAEGVARLALATQDIAPIR